MIICKICKYTSLTLLGGIIFFILFHHTILPWYARLLYVNNMTKGADAIVLLAGNPMTRIDKVVELFKQGYAPLVLRTDTKETPETRYPSIIKTQTQMAIEVLELEKIRHVLVENKNKGVTSTFDEARDVAEYAKKNGLKRIIIVTDPSHTRRATFAFQKIFDAYGVMTIIQTAATRPLSDTQYRWWKHEAMLVEYFFEGLKFLYYMLNDRNFAYIEAA